MSTLTLETFFARNADKIPVQWLAGTVGGQRPLTLGNEERPLTACAVVNFYNPIRPPQIQIIADLESAHIHDADEAALHRQMETVLAKWPAVCLILANQPCPSSLRKLADKYALPLLSSDLTGQILVTKLQREVTRLHAPRMTLHGVFMDVLGMGVLIMGESGSGKSELALELISRGHRLVADDAPEFRRVEPNDLRGSCPHDMGMFLEVRGLGVLNIKKLFGETAVKSRKYLHLIVRLEHRVEMTSPMERLEGIRREQTVLGVTLPEIVLPVAPSRNLAVLLECAVRNHSLRLGGYHALEDLSARQMNLIQGHRDPCHRDPEAAGVA